MNVLAMLAGSTVGALYDPFTQGMAGIVVLLALLESRWWSAPLVALAFNCAHMMLMAQQWAAIGLSWQRQFWWLLLVKLVIVAAAFLIGRGLAYLWYLIRNPQT